MNNFNDYRQKAVARQNCWINVLCLIVGIGGAFGFPAIVSPKYGGSLPSAWLLCVLTMVGGFAYAAYMGIHKDDWTQIPCCIALFLPCLFMVPVGKSYDLDRLVYDREFVSQIKWDDDLGLMFNPTSPSQEAYADRWIVGWEDFAKKAPINGNWVWYGLDLKPGDRIKFGHVYRGLEWIVPPRPVAIEHIEPIETDDANGL